MQQAAAQRDATPRRAAAAYGKTAPGSDADSSD
jgi:hypothetical protein